MKPSTEADFWAKTKPVESGCWEWQGSCLRSGYGQVKYQGTQYLAHRVAAYLAGILPSLAKGRSGPYGFLVCHSCDNKKCCNPEHLSLGTAQSNIRDAYDRGLVAGRPGTKHHAVKLSDSDIIEMRRRHAEGETATDLAAHFGISRTHAGRIVRGERWSHIPKPSYAPPDLTGLY